MRHIGTADPSHPGHQYIVKSLDDFTHVGPNGQHSCIIFEPLGQSVLNFQKKAKDGLLPLQMVRTIARQTLLALDYLHSCCKLVHSGSPDQTYIELIETDLTSANILFDVGNITQDNARERMSTNFNYNSEESSPIITSNPINLSIDKPLKIKITDFGVGICNF
jgi:serine/threonine protein kinase